MSISLECPACGRQYQLKADMAGRRANCKCGQAMTVPDPDAESAVDLDGLPELPGAPPPGKTADYTAAKYDVPTEPSPPPEDLGGWGAPVAASPQAGKLAPPQPKRRKRHDSGMRVPIAILAIVYGSILALWEALRTLQTFSLLSLDFMWLGIACAVVAGGVLLLKNHPAAPGTTGLACLLATFWPAYSALDRGVRLLAARFSLWGLPFLLLGFLLMGVAGVIITWCLREEKRRERNKLPPI